MPIRLGPSLPAPLIHIRFHPLFPVVQWAKSSQGHFPFLGRVPFQEKFLLESLVIALRRISWLVNQGTHPISAFLWVLVSYHPWYRLFSCAPVRSPSYTWCAFFPFELMQRPNSPSVAYAKQARIKLFFWVSMIVPFSGRTWWTERTLSSLIQFRVPLKVKAATLIYTIWYHSPWMRLFKQSIAAPSSLHTSPLTN